MLIMGLRKSVNEWTKILIYQLQIPNNNEKKILHLFYTKYT